MRSGFHLTHYIYYRAGRNPKTGMTRVTIPAIGPTCRPVILRLASARFVHYFADNSIPLRVNMFPLPNSAFGSRLWGFERTRESWRSKTIVHVHVPAGVVDPEGLAGREGRITDATDQARPGTERGMRG
jgi:hypothetical protein